MTTGATDRWWVRLSWLWLAMLVPSLLFSNGRWQIAVAAVAAPLFARLFLLSRPLVKGLLILLPLQIGIYFVMWWEVIPAPGWLYYVIAAAYGLCYLLPFAIDRAVSGRIPGFAGTLVLPLSWYLVEILIQQLTPYGSWSSAGYTQAGNGLLLPLAAWVGVSGVAFVTVWFASVLSWALTATAPITRRLYAPGLWAGATILLAWLAGSNPADDTTDMNLLTVAGITPSNEATLRVDRAVMEGRRAGEFDDATLARLDSAVSELNDGLILRSLMAADNGADLIVWSETAGRALASDEGRLIARGQQVARDAGIYLFMGLGVFNPGSQPPLENKVIAIAPSGEVAWQYRKARPIVGSEAPLLPPGHDEMATLDTPFGRIGLVICHDLDFADFITQAGRKSVALLLAPSADWPVIADLHARMGILRAVENGFWLLRPAHDGLSVIASPAGRLLVSEYDAELDDRTFAGQVPLTHRPTVYPHIRRYLPFVAAALLIALIGLAARRP